MNVVDRYTAESEVVTRKSSSATRLSDPLKTPEGLLLRQYLKPYDLCLILSVTSDAPDNRYDAMFKFSDARDRTASFRCRCRVSVCRACIQSAPASCPHDASQVLLYEGRRRSP